MRRDGICWEYRREFDDDDDDLRTKKRRKRKARQMRMSLKLMVDWVLDLIFLSFFLSFLCDERERERGDGFVGCECELII